MPHEPERIVADTNLLVSRLLLPQSVPAEAVRKAVDEDQLLESEATLEELADVLSRAKFDPYVSLEDRQAFIRVLNRIAERVIVTAPIQACRDPKDDKFLEVALHGQAKVILPGDRCGCCRRRTGTASPASGSWARPAMAARADSNASQRAGAGALPAIGGGAAGVSCAHPGAVGARAAIQAGSARSSRVEQDQPAFA